VVTSSDNSHFQAGWCPSSMSVGNLGEKRTDFEVKQGNWARMLGIDVGHPGNAAPDGASSTVFLSIAAPMRFPRTA
jgi:hypothetical protein